METTEMLRTLLVEGKSRSLAEQVIPLSQRERYKLCRPLVKQANTILGAGSGSTATEWLRGSSGSNPDRHEQLSNPWKGRLGRGHYDAATTVLLASKAPAQAAKVWPLPMEEALSAWLYPALFPNDLPTFAEQWCADFVAHPKHWDRNNGRTVMYEWIEQGIIEAPDHDGAVLMTLGWVAAGAGGSLLRWLERHPVVTDKVFRRILTTPGIKGASLTQADDTNAEESIRTQVIPGLIERGIWTGEFVEAGVRTALSSDLPPYQMRWFKRLAADLGLAATP